MMKITILGSGTILSPAKRNPAGYLIQTKGCNALLDCGPGILKQLSNKDFNVLDLDAVFISHFHLDHCADVFPLLMKRYLLQSEANKKLKIYGPQNLKFWFDTIALTQGSWLHNTPPTCIGMHQQEKIWQDLVISCRKNGHLDNSISYSFKDKSKHFFFSSDTDYNEDLLEIASKADLAIMECSYPDEQPKKGHLTPEKLARFIKKAALKKTVVTHIYPENDTADLLDRIKKYQVENVEIGCDYMELSLK